MWKSFRGIVVASLCVVAWGWMVGVCQAGMVIYMTESGDTQPILENYSVVPDTSVEMDVRIRFDEYALLLHEENGFGPLYHFSPSSGEHTPLWQVSWVDDLPPDSIFGRFLSSEDYSMIFYKNIEEGGLYLNAAEWTPQNAEGWDGRIAPGDYLLGRIQVQLDASTEIGTAWNFKILYGLASYEVIDAMMGESLDFAITPGDGGEATLLTLVASETPEPIAPAVPEPSTWAVFMGMGLVGGLIFRRRSVENPKPEVSWTRREY